MIHTQPVPSRDLNLKFEKESFGSKNLNRLYRKVESNFYSLPCHKFIFRVTKCGYKRRTMYSSFVISLAPGKAALLGGNISWLIQDTSHRNAIKIQIFASCFGSASVVQVESNTFPNSWSTVWFLYPIFTKKAFGL